MRVAIVQQVLPQYRLPFFQSLHDVLEARGVDLELIYGQEAPGCTPRTVPMDVPWAYRVENRYLRIRGRHLVWQPCLSQTKGADLVVVGHANRSLVNYLLFASRALFSGVRRLALWGHGRNFRSTERDRYAEALKRKLATSADWWFAYTERSAEVMRSQGVPPDRITVVDNAFDTNALATAARTLDPGELTTTRAQLGIPADAPVVLFCGGLRREKNVELLLRACQAARKLVPELHLLIIGEGPDAAKVNAAAAQHPWIHPLGAIYGPERVKYFAISEAMLIPIGVGLVVLDAFVTGTPLIAMDSPTHGPESAYLEHDVNGLLSEASIEGYAHSIARFLSDASLRERLRAGCATSAQRYTLTNMVERFASGILASVR